MTSHNVGLGAAGLTCLGPRNLRTRPEPGRFQGVTHEHRPDSHIDGLRDFDGKFDEFESVAKQMVEQFEQESGTLTYHFVLSADRKRCRLIQGYADQAAITAHWIDGPAVHQHIFQLQQLALPTRVEVYGDPGPRVSALAAEFGAEIFTSWEGFDR